MENLSVCLRPMTLSDVDEVHALDALAYPIAWPASIYTREIKANTSHFFVLETPACTPGNGSLLRRLLRPAEDPKPRIIGFSGMWTVIDEAHVSTIAIHPEWHGRKLGELLFWNMIRQAFYLRVEKVTLEVRLSNSIAQNLYRKYGLEVVGVRKGYYSDNGEDAYMMLNNEFSPDYRSWIAERGEQLFSLFRVVDRAIPESIHAGTIADRP